MVYLVINPCTAINLLTLSEVEGRSPMCSGGGSSEPREIDGVVERNVCISGPESCCATSLRIKIKKCSTFMAYCLKRFSSCPIGYCFGKTNQ
ncbi:hypothetical protein KUTeg_012188 [Tegillarca granosa]|uniref:Uncharacterized protein n=1 Tax=Tegillarca granosa TaxID=220873 RepID=A0ABQ9EYU9_TEGGR|nr:hypothetical protein KUTeg_012188 [Tegillarca granosa]